ncbi:sugar phosphate isomerase/epimerase family protein [Kocuria carniphila]|uniref:sugar phosphate isomerase/epimerase family protein n=1 Tax=Kocuria carniphila TaxID=262208 RepID=UPI0034CF8638
MKLGVYNAILHNLPLEQALDAVADLGLDGVELNTGGFLPPVHVPVDEILENPGAAARFREAFSSRGLEILGLNCNGNPLHPNPRIGPAQAEDIRRSIRVAAALGQQRVVTMSGLPGTDAGASRPGWNVNAWSSGALDSLDYQWDLACDFWTEIDTLAREHGVKVALEMHPQNLVFNPPTLKRLVDRIGATNIGAEMDPSHLFWQGMDPVKCVRWLGPLVFHAAAKDIRINSDCEIYGVLDERFRRLTDTEERTGLGGDEYVNEWPSDSSWDFVALGAGHNAHYWADFLRALHDVDPDMSVNIEHEDTSMGALEGLRFAKDTLFEAAAEAGIRASVRS